jgi:hypothetical protein
MEAFFSATKGEAGRRAARRGGFQAGQTHQKRRGFTTEDAKNTKDEGRD